MDRLNDLISNFERKASLEPTFHDSGRLDPEDCHDLSTCKVNTCEHYNGPHLSHCGELQGDDRDCPNHWRNCEKNQ